jgi:prophage regulatory protein
MKKLPVSPGNMPAPAAAPAFLDEVLTAPRAGDSVRHMPDVVGRVGVSEQTIYAWIRKGEFPAPFSLSPTGRKVAWLESQIDHWLADRFKAAHAKGGRRELPRPNGRKRRAGQESTGSVAGA